jgi:predicted PurR-regulated permease PerM
MSDKTPGPPSPRLGNVKGSPRFSVSPSTPILSGASEKRTYSVAVGIIFLLLLLVFVFKVAEVLLLFFIAILFGVYLSWITEALQRYLGLPRWLGLLGALLITAAAATGLGFLIVPALIEQGQELIRTLPETLAAVEVTLLDLARRNSVAAQMLGTLDPGQSYTGNFIKEVTGSTRSMVPYLFSGVGFAIHFISVLVMGIYLALRPAVYREGFILLAPPVHRELVRDLLSDLGRTLRAWIVGQLLAMFSLGLLTWFGLWLLGVPYPIAFGVFTGVVAIVPFFGTLVSTILPALFVIAEGGLWQFFWVAQLGVWVHVFEANIVAPMIMERQVHLPPVLSILSVLIMAHLLHLIGLLVAVPVLCTVMVIARRVYVHRVLEGKGFRRAIRDRPIEIKLSGDGGGVLVHPSAYQSTVPALLER